MQEDLNKTQATEAPAPAAAPPCGCTITAEEIISATQEEMQNLRRRVYQLELLAGRFTRLAEQAFQEELQKRTSPEKNYGGEALRIDELERLKARGQHMRRERGNLGRETD